VVMALSREGSQTVSNDIQYEKFLRFDVVILIPGMSPQASASELCTNINGLLAVAFQLMLALAGLAYDCADTSGCMAVGRYM